LLHAAVFHHLKGLLNKMRIRLICITILLLVAPAAFKANPQQPDNAPPADAIAAVTSLLESNTLFAVYGRSFNRAPILGRLGTYKGFDDMAADIQPWLEKIPKFSDKKGIVPGIHLIYAMATPCKTNNDCLLYLDGPVKDIAGTYIEPAAKLGWSVVLDTQLGKSDPVRQVKRMIDKGYLKYNNVHVAIDPEFHTAEDSDRPGKPIGTVKASQINEVQKMLDNYVRTEKLATKKILIVHQFGDDNIRDGVPVMIEDKKTLKTYDNVDLVITMDGLGKQPVKVVNPFIKFRGIKIFFNNRWEKHGHFDKPPLTIDQIFGVTKVKGGRARMQTKPDVIIIA
jgi:hypothetical protein